MINPPNTNSINSYGIMEPTYDDRPISMYDNLNNMTTNMNPATTTTTMAVAAMNSSTPKMTKAPTMATTVTATATPSPLPPPTTTTSSKTNGAAHSTPFTDITFKFNENNNIPQLKQQQQHQQLPINGNRNLNEIPPNTGNNAAVYATPYKTSAAIKPLITTASPTPHSLSETTPTTITNSLTSSPSLLLHTNAATTTPTAAATTTTTAAPPTTVAINSDTFNSFNRPLSQHSQSELNDTSHSIAAVKAALNEAKSKFFGLNGYVSSQELQQQQQQQHLQDHYDDNYGEESPNHQLLPLNDHLHQLPQQLQQQQVQKPQPKYQNIPENSAIFRNQTAAAAAPPELPPKPIEYQNLQQPTTASTSIHTTPDHFRKMPNRTATYNQISLNDIDGSASPSQTVYMATTVPQNIKGNKIAGRHTPTRSSLRHSRMLVVNNKSYEEVQHPNPMGFQQPNLARWLLILQIIIGILLLSLSTWIFFLTPNTPVQDNPYWCGLVLLITGIIGLIVIRYQRIKRAKTREHCFMFLRMDSYVLSLLSVLLCCVALIFAAIHYCRLTAADTKCKSMNLLLEHGSCICTFNAPAPPVNATEPLLNETSYEEDEEISDNSYNVEYRDLSCQEVTGPWTSILGLSFILNCLGFVISLAYIILLACCRKSSKRLYTTVRTSTF